MSVWIGKALAALGSTRALACSFPRPRGKAADKKATDEASVAAREARALPIHLRKRDARVTIRMTCFPLSVWKSMKRVLGVPDGTLTRSAPMGAESVTIPFLLASIFYLQSSSFVTAQQNATDTLKNIGIEQRLNEQVPLDLAFCDESGKMIRLGDYYDGKPVMLALVYYECPMLCNEVLNGLLRSLRALQFDVGKEFTVVTVSFDPRETSTLAATKKQQYLKQYGRAGAENGWHFLTGDEESIRALTQAVGFRYVYDEKSGQFAHAAAIIVTTPQGKLSRYFYGIEYPPKDLRLGLVEASEGKIGALSDRVLLFCYRYDPTTGKYGFAIMNAIRVGGALTVLCLGTFIVVMIRRGRKAERGTENGGLRMEN